MAAEHEKGNVMANYLLLIYDSEAAWANAGPDDIARIHQAHMRFGEDNGASIRGGDALQPTSTATSLRPESSGEITVTDGAFAETKEALGGYYVVEADDLDGAIAIAKQIPTLAGGIEVRPVMVFE
jgi:hypothetical protein